MRVLMLSVDLGVGYPRGERALRMATALAAAGHDVEVLARDAADAGAASVTQIHDAPPMIEFWERSRWAMQFSSMMLERATVAIAERGVDVVHAHDWEVSWAARSAALVARVPLITTLHSTELTRGDGQLPFDDSAFIDGAERALCQESAVAIAPTEAMGVALQTYAPRVETIEMASISDDQLGARLSAAYELVSRAARPRAHEHVPAPAAPAREQLG